MSDAAAKPLGRPMKFPYTFSAKIAQFPLKFYVQKQWGWRYYGIALLVSAPVFYKISKLGECRQRDWWWCGGDCIIVYRLFCGFACVFVCGTSTHE